MTLGNNDESPSAPPPVTLEGQLTPTMMQQLAVPRAPEAKHPQTGSSRGKLADSNLDTASGDCLSCSDTNDIFIRTACKKYRKRVRAS